MFGTAAFLMLAASSSAAAADGPLSQAEHGFVQCYEPDETNRTCASIASYRRNNDGTWDNTAVVLLAPTRPVTLETVTPVTVKGAAVCGFIRRADVLRGKLKVSDQVVPGEQAGTALSKIADGMAPLMGKEICTEYARSGDGLIAKGKISGTPIAVPDQHVKWVLPTDGYSVAPASAKSQ